MAERARPPAPMQAPPPSQQPQQQPPFYAPSRGPTDLPLSLSTLTLVLRDAEYLTSRYGSTAAACARLDELERAHVELQAQVTALQQKLGLALEHANMNGTVAPTLFDVDALLQFLQRHVACRGDLALLLPVLGDFQRSLVLPRDARFPSRDVLVSVHEMVDSGPQSQHPQHHPIVLHSTGLVNDMGHSPMPHDVARKKRHPDVTRLTPKDKAPGSATSSPVRAASNGTSTPRLIAPAGPPPPTSSTTLDRRARQEEKQAASAAAMLSALSRPTTSTPTKPMNNSAKSTAKVTPTTTRRSLDAAAAPADATATPPKKRRAEDGGAPEASGDETDSAVSTRKRSTSIAAAASHEVVVKQNLSLPHDKRNIVELKQSSQHLTLENLDELNRRAPWDDVYKLRATFSHVLDYRTLDERARKWFVGALRIQFVWRREFWERLHWLPMSETVCIGAGWERYRQTRKRRANKAIAAWRKVYSDSLELMRQRLLPEDVWCDVALWYMPSTPLYWLPNSPDLDAELVLVDAKHPVRSYFVHDFRKHPFYNDDDIQRKYPHKFDLPTPQMLAVPIDDKESRVNITPE